MHPQADAHTQTTNQTHTQPHKPTPNRARTDTRQPHRQTNKQRNRHTQPGRHTHRQTDMSNGQLATHQRSRAWNAGAPQPDARIMAAARLRTFTSHRNPAQPHAPGVVGYINASPNLGPDWRCTRAYHRQHVRTHMYRARQTRTRKRAGAFANSQARGIRMHTHTNAHTRTQREIQRRRQRKQQAANTHSQH